MDDILCPSCGKPNIAGAETCWNCGARLQPEDSGAPAPSENLPDWLSGLSGDSSEPAPWPGAPEAGEEPTAEEGQVPDWLARIRAQQKGPEPAGEDAEDWLSGLTQDEPAAAEPVPDWLSGQPEQPAAQDWLGALRDADTPATQDAAPQPEIGEDDWVKSLAAWQSAEENAPAAETSAGDLPSAGAMQFDLPEEPAQSEPPSAEALWPLAAEAAGAPDASETVTPAFTDLPDWLSAMNATEDQAALPSEAAPSWSDTPAFQASDLPDWLSSMPGEEADTPVDEPPATGGLPPFIGSLTDRPEEPQELENVPPFTLSDAAEPPLEQVDDTPDWLKTFSANLQPEETELPALNASNALETPSFEEEPAPFEESALPEWLAEADQHLSASLEQPAEESAAGDLESAQLPGWLQAMRPVEAVLGENALQPQPDALTERAGPLAGLVGALPGESLVTQYQKLPPYSARLQVSERQRASVSLIEALLAEDTRPKPPRAERSHWPQRITRLVIALLFLAALLVPLVSGMQLMPMPDLYPPETVAFHSLVEQLPAGAPVLLAVDYEPALSGEMRLASSAVVDHLMARNARLAVLSTAPVGPVLADQLLRDANARNGDYALSDLSVNLGFLPGGTAGLQEFASRPQAALPYTHDGKRMAWSQPALAGVSNLQEFALLVVLTENAETARAWVEQVQPSLGDVPLLFVISAQSAPFLQPYLDSGQVQAMVSGMAGGSMYAQITNQPGSGRAYWDAYQFGLFLAALLIVLGGLIAAFSAALTRRPSRKGA